jgi:tetratricopeptide (TPR) repeat protein
MARDTKGQDKTVRSDEHNSRGIELADRGWLDEAIKEFKKAIELDPESAHAHDNLATVYSEKKLYAQALEEYLTALRLEPDSATAHYNLACFLATHSHEMAVEEYKQAIELDPEYPDAHLNLGMTYADLDQRDEAKAEFKSAIELDPADPLARHELAAMLMDEGDYRGAIALLNEVVRLEPSSYEAWLDLGISYAQKGFYQEAERCYGKARDLNPDDVLLNYNVAALYSLWERRPEALASLRKALEKDPAKVRGWLAADPMFDALKGAPEFEQLLAVQ